MWRVRLHKNLTFLQQTSEGSREVSKMNIQECEFYSKIAMQSHKERMLIHSTSESPCSIGGKNRILVHLLQTYLLLVSFHSLYKKKSYLTIHKVFLLPTYFDFSFLNRYLLNIYHE